MQRTVPKGKGVVDRIVDRSSVEAHLRRLRPHSPSKVSEDLPQRAANLATHRDSKALKSSHDVHYVLLKASGNDVRWTSPAGRILDLSSATTMAGVGALAIKSADDWQSDRPLWLVENQALFDRIDWFPAGMQASIMYYAGQIPDRVLDWLATKPRAPEVVLFPDYDGVGLQNYVRLLERCRSRCTFWLMPEWQALLAKYGGDAVWQATRPQFVTAATRLGLLAAPREVLELCAVMSREGRALEHEAVWLSRGH